MQDKGKRLAQVYELILGREVVDAILGIARHDKTLAVSLMSIALKAGLGGLPIEEAIREIDLLLVNYEQLRGGTTLPG